MKTISIKGSFDAAHRLLNYEGKCKNLHGHTWHYEIEFEQGNLNVLGISTDFKMLKRLVQMEIDEKFDHATLLNSEDVPLIDFLVETGNIVCKISFNPTAENLSNDIFDRVRRSVYNSIGIKLYSLKLYETPNNFVTIYGK